MNGLSASSPMDSGPSHMPSGSIPVLSTVIPEEDVSQALRDALDARAQKKADWLSMEPHLIQALRPELERMTTELVRAGLHEAWRQHADLTVDLPVPTEPSFF